MLAMKLARQIDGTGAASREAVAGDRGPAFGPDLGLRWPLAADAVSPDARESAQVLDTLDCPGLADDALAALPDAP